MKDSKMLQLRQIAEELSKHRELLDKIEFTGDIEKLLEELNIYQIELQMQNQELQMANQQVELERQRYYDLFIDAPIAYVTLNKTGNIIELNNAAAKLFNLPIYQFRYTSIFPYIEPSSKINFTKYFKTFFDSDKVEYGEITFIKSNNELLHTKLSAVRYFDNKVNDYLCRCAITDITDLKKLESEKTLLEKIAEQNKQLLDSEILLNQTGALANIGGWKIDLSTQELTWTQQVYRIHEVEESFHPKFENALNFYEETSRKILQDAVLQAIETGSTFDVELNLITAKGNHIVVRVIGKVEFDENKKGQYIYGSIQDITTLRQTEKELIAIRQRLEEAQRTAHMGNWELDIINNHLTWSDEIYRIFDCEPQEFQATYEAFLGFVHPEDRDFVNKAYTNSLKTKEPYDIIHRLVTKDGTIKFVRERCETIFDNDGKPLLSKGIVLDVTDLKQKEEELRFLSQRYKQLFEFMPVGISLADGEGNLIEYNKEAGRLLGISQEEHNNRSIGSQEWKIIRKDGSIMPPEEFASVRALRENKLIENVELGIDKGNNEIVWLNVSAVPKTYAKGLIISYIDITEKIDRERQLIKVSEELKLTNETKDKFLSIIAHDLKNPFHTIIAYSDIIINNIDKYDKEKILNILNNIYDSSKTAYNLLDNLLLWASAQSNKISFISSKNNLKEIVLENILVIENQAKKKEIKIDIDIEGEPYVACDRNMITTVVRNLLTNAVKFTNKNGQINVSIKRDGYDYITTIRDNGVGISPENLNKLFKIDSKFQTKGTLKESGTGLGLILCKEFVDFHYGKIWAESEVGKGSSFMFTIPVCPEENYD